MFKNLFQKIPKLPLSALIFYIGAFVLWKLNFIPSPLGILDFLESLYASYGLIGLFIASFLEGIVYFGLYFPGSFVIALAVILSNGNLISLVTISIVVAIALTITSTINYVFGRGLLSKYISKNFLEKKSGFSKGILISALHPNALAFYFFNLGLKRKNPLKIILVPIIMIPYGFLLALLIFSLKEPLRGGIESPYIMIIAITIWFLIAFVLKNKNENNNF